MAQLVQPFQNSHAPLELQDYLGCLEFLEIPEFLVFPAVQLLEVQEVLACFSTSPPIARTSSASSCPVSQHSISYVPVVQEVLFPQFDLEVLHFRLIQGVPVVLTFPDALVLLVTLIHQEDRFDHMNQTVQVVRVAQVFH